MIAMGRPERRRRSIVLRERAEQAIAPKEGYLFAQIADDVAARRADRGLSQRELAELTGTTQSAIARLERGGRPPRIDGSPSAATAVSRRGARLRPRASSSSSPLKFGGRFSRNAVTPSRKSWVSVAADWSSASSSSCSSSLTR